MRGKAGLKVSHNGLDGKAVEQNAKGVTLLAAGSGQNNFCRSIRHGVEEAARCPAINPGKEPKGSRGMGRNAAEGRRSGDGIEGVGAIQLDQPGATLVEQVGSSGGQFYPTRDSYAKLAYCLQRFPEFGAVLIKENRGNKPAEGAADRNWADLATVSERVKARRFEQNAVRLRQGLRSLKAEESKPAEERKQRS
jgi:hypothetical protein